MNHLVETLPAGLVTGNYFDKYRSENPIHRKLVNNFLRCAKELLVLARPKSILEVGCGPGDLAGRLLGPANRTIDYLGTDVSTVEIDAAQQRYPGLAFRTASAYHLPAADRSYDMLLACEVFEHLDYPHEALREAARVCRGHLLISVPWEPCWRILNVLRGKYIKRLGNTPGHVQHFTRRAIKHLVAREFRIVAERRPFPWTMLLAKVARSGSVL